jgi:anti-sigma regulatory factor (Ser/Thr protein kinase)
VSAGAISLHGVGVQPGTLAAAAAAAGIGVAPAGAAPSPEDIVLFATTDRAGLTELIVRGYRGLIDGAGRAPETAVKAAVAANGATTLSLASTTAWAIDCAALVCDALEARQTLTAERRADVELALHEAVANAVIHGNLAIGSSFGTTADSFDAFCKLVSDRMGDPAHGSKRVTIGIVVEEGRLELRVGDEGAGYDPASLAARAPDATSGRGLEIMRAMAGALSVEDGGRTLVLSFAP